MLPEHSTQQRQAVAPLSWIARRWDSFGRISHNIHPQPRNCAISVNQGQAQEPKLVSQLELLLSPQLLLLNLLLLRVAVPALEGNRSRTSPLYGRGQRCSHQGLQDSDKPE